MENLNGYVGKAFHCPTKKLANEFLNLAHGQGWTWVDNGPLNEYNKWWVCKERTCYLLFFGKTVMYAPIDYYKQIGFKIIEFKGERK